MSNGGMMTSRNTCRGCAGVATALVATPAPAAIASTAAPASAGLSRITSVR